MFQFLSLCLLILIVEHSCSFDIRLNESSFNTSYFGTVNRTTETVFEFKDEVPFSNDYYISAEVSCSGSNRSKICPIHFVMQRNYVQVFDLPKNYDPDNLLMYSSTRTLCIDTKGNVSIFVTVSTCNSDNVNFTLELSNKTGFLVALDAEPTHAVVSPHSPALFSFKFPNDGMKFVKILANSSTKSKTYLSIQNPTCPVNDEITNIKSKGRWVSMSELATITILKKDFPDGFYIVFLPDERTDIAIEEITFKIIKGEETNLLALLFPTGIYFVCIVFVYLGYSYSHQLYIRGYRDVRTEWAPQGRGNAFDLTHLRVLDMTRDVNLYKYLTEHSYRYFWTMLSIAVFYCLPVTLLIINLSKLMEVSGNMDTCALNYLCSHPLWKFTSFNCIFSNFGYLLLGLMFMFLVHMRAKKLKVINDYPETPIETHNTWSFKAIFRFSTVALTPTGYGAYQNFGIYYTLGFCLMMTGVLKALYSVCPDTDTAFFGTSFNLVIILLSEIKIYNLRHPCIITDNFTYGTIATVLSILVGGYLSDNQPFQIGISIFLSFIVQTSILILSSGGYATRRNDVHSSVGACETEQDGGSATLISNEDSTAARNGTESLVTETLITNPTSLFLNVVRDCNISSLFLTINPETQEINLYQTAIRIFWPSMRLLVNIGTLAFIWVYMPNNHFITQMFFLFQNNFLYDFIYYFVVMKWLYKEYNQKMSFQPVIYLMLSITSWVFVFYLLSHSMLEWRLPAILLREDFKGCIDPFGYYDYTDLYHLFGAPAWFFTFMVMLTADDALSRVSCEMTPVF